MSEQKPAGYVVRMKGGGRYLKNCRHDDPRMWAWSDARADAVPMRLPAAAAVVEAERGACILAVHADGTETPLPTYEEALAEIERLAATGAALTNMVDVADRLRMTVTREREAERTAWARLVNATTDSRDAMFAEEQGRPGSADWLERARAERKAAEKALRDLGVDVDGLTRRTK